MSGFIPQEAINNVKEAVNIRQVIEAYVPLKKSGRNWVGLCPFHPDKDPSFSVNEEKQIFYCFGCSQGGNVFNFLMKIEGMSFAESVKRLADSHGITLPDRPSSPREKAIRKERDVLSSLNKEAAFFYSGLLENSRDAQEAKEYLRQRGLSQKTILKFQLGWAPDKWDSLLNYLKSKGVAPELAEKAGLLVSRQDGSGYYDRFRSRIIFPIQDYAGRVTALGGRILGDGIPKYLNSPESPIYHKGKILYGLYQNKGAIRNAGHGFVVEGYMDLLALYQWGVYPVVATLGTALTEQHIKKMNGLSREWSLVFDGDHAGAKAALRSLPLFYKEGLYPKVVTLPEGDDPDSFIRREGKDEWDAHAKSAKSGLDFVIEMGPKDNSDDGPEDKMKIVDNIIHLLEPISDPVKKSLFAGHAAQKLGIREDALWQRLKTRHTASSFKKGSTDDSGDKKTVLTNKAEEKLISFLLSMPQYIPVFLESDMELWLEVKELRDIWTSVVHIFEISNDLDIKLLFKHLEASPRLLSLSERLLSDFPPCDRHEEMADSLMRYCKERKKKNLRQHIIQKLKSGDEPDGQENLLKHFQQLR